MEVDGVGILVGCRMAIPLLLVRLAVVALETESGKWDRRHPPNGIGRCLLLVSLVRGYDPGVPETSDHDGPVRHLDPRFRRKRLRGNPANGRSTEMPKVNAALQASIEALAREPALESFVPSVLRVSAETFGASSCSFFEVDDNEVIFLRYVYHQGRVITPLELPLLDDATFATLKRLAEGFTVPVEHLGVHPTRRRSPVILDHRSARNPNEFNTFAIRVGWELELNIPLLVGETMRGAFLIHRNGDAAFSTSEILLAETLGRQLTFAMQASQNATREREAAIARERQQTAQQAAQERAEELAKANNALQATMDATSQVQELDQLVPVVLGIIGDVFEAGNCAIYENLPSGEVRLRYWHSNGKTLLPSELFQLDEERYSLIRRLAAGFFVPPDYLGLDSRIPGTVLLDHTKGTTVPEFDQWAMSIGLELELNIGIGGRGLRSSTLCIYRKQGQPFAPREIVLAESLARQIGLAMQMTKLSQAGRDAAISREREQAARQKAEELAKANAILTLRDRLLSLVAEASRELIRAPDLIAGIHSLLRRMGESTGLSRVAFFLERPTLTGEGEHCIVAEWCATGIADHRTLGIEVIPNSMAKPLLERMRNLSGFWLDMDRVEEPLRSTLAPLKIVSTGCAPVIVDGECAGVIAFDDCSSLRCDDSAHVDAFLAVANSIGAALQRDRSQKALLAEQRGRASSEAKALHEREAAILQERTRFAGQIHDTLAQGFTGTLLHLEALRVRVARGGRVTVEELQNIRKIAALGLAEARRSALAIRPLALDGRDLSTALQQLTDRSGVPGLLDCRWSMAGTPRPLSPTTDEVLLNIAHEALSNAIRHSDASNILITLAFDPEAVSLLVQDDGIGFDASDSHLRGHTFGLRSMRERATAAGGDLTVVSKHGEGTTVSVQLPTA